MGKKKQPWWFRLCDAIIWGTLGMEAADAVYRAHYNKVSRLGK